MPSEPRDLSMGGDMASNAAIVDDRNFAVMTMEILNESSQVFAHYVSRFMVAAGWRRIWRSV